jgi:gamma-glutamylputrescine oxidase
VNPGTYYAASAGPAPARPALSGRVDTQVCVVGGGFAGLATAVGLIERGMRDVVILEAEAIGHGASGRNGGFVFGGFSLDNERLLADQGRERARALYGLTRHRVRRGGGRRRARQLVRRRRDPAAAPGRHGA